MRRPDYIPTTDEGFDTFQKNLVKQVTDNAAAWQIWSVALAKLSPLQAKWVATWGIAVTKTKRSMEVVSAKNQARRTYVKELRLFIQAQIFRNPAMKEGDIQLCGLKPYDKTKTPPPLLSVLPSIFAFYLPGNILLFRFYRLEGEAGKFYRGKPKGAARLELRYNIGAEPASPDDCEFTENVGRSPIRIQLQPQHRGQKVWFYARWLNVRNEPGPWTDLGSFLL